MIKKIALAVLLAALPASAPALQTNELLSLVAMPLAVAAVSEIADVPISQLMDVVAMLNQADVPPAQFIEVVRYVPVALVVENDDPDFVEFVRLRRDEGLRGDAFVTVIEERIRSFGVPVEFNVTAQPVIVVQQDFVPAIVRTRVKERKTHPHGGPPGQLKKVVGVQTGAEIVHGERRGRGRDDDDVVKVRVDDRGRGQKVKVVKVDDDGGKGKDKGKGDKGNDGGKGKGKGKGKD